ncbi:hypothetical protein ACIA5G_11540 [Amycolatopsis sp. NPDC051758]|uniref:hypothetical protein n=1 Tax=Amycolatopsis sp. NPDC051758 TaxID=3363935 RepID=UPI00379A3F33
MRSGSGGRLGGDGLRGRAVGQRPGGAPDHNHADHDHRTGHNGLPGDNDNLTRDDPDPRAHPDGDDQEADDSAPEHHHSPPASLSRIPDCGSGGW